MAPGNSGEVDNAVAIAPVGRRYRRSMAACAAASSCRTVSSRSQTGVAEAYRSPTVASTCGTTRCEAPPLVRLRNPRTAAGTGLAGQITTSSRPSTRPALAFCWSDSPSKPSSASSLHTSTGSDVGLHCRSPSTAVQDHPSARRTTAEAARPSFDQRIRLMTTPLLPTPALWKRD